MKFFAGNYWLLLGILAAMFYATPPDLARGQNFNPYTLLPLTNVWRYNVSGLDLGTSWQQPLYDDSIWPSGRGVLGYEDNNALTISLTNTVLPLSNSFGAFITNFYFRTHFTLTNDPGSVVLTTSNLIDDGAVFYLNGTEYTRIRMPTGPINATTFAQTAPEGVFTNVVIPANLLAQGDNVLAVEVHQTSATSSDIVFGTAILVSPVPQGPPVLTAQPTNNTIFIGQNNTFSASATGALPLSFQWFRNGAAIANATNNTFTQVNIQAAQAGNYFLLVTNPVGMATSSVVTLTVIGGEANLRLVEFNNTWRFDDSGANLGTNWRAAAYDDSGWALGSGVFAKSAMLFPEPVNTVLPLANSSGSAIITYYFRTHFNVPSGHGNLVLVASNLLDDGAVFYLNGFEAGRVRINGTVTSSTFAVNAAQNGTAYEMLSLAATNLALGDNVLAVEVHQSSAVSSDVVFGSKLGGYPLNTEPLSLLSEPASQIAPEGQPASFFADVFGGQPVFYQWFKDGAPLSGATNAHLLLASVHGANTGDYLFIASNLLNAATSTVAHLSMAPDQIPPTLVAAFATNDFNTVLVVFSEPVSAATATDVSHYSFSPAVTILSAQQVAPNQVLLVTSGRDPQFEYTLSVAGVTDQADVANVMTAASQPVGRDTREASTGLRQVQTVFVIIMENQDWSSIKGNTNCPYINGVLLPQASYCERYRSHKSLHPSEPNYIWLESGDNFGYADDAGPVVDRVHSTNHLVTLLNNAGIDWRGYMENMPAGVTGTNDASPYVARHNPFAFFDDVTLNFDYCTNHVRPYSRFAGDLAANRIGRYNFITPNITNDMHNLAPGSTSQVRQGDTWLSQELPTLLNSTAFANNGAVFIVWDESDLSTTNPCGMIVLSPLAKGGGFASTVDHDHSSTLCTMQIIFGVRPLLADAGNANTLSELFQELTLTPVQSGQNLGVMLSNPMPGKTNYVQASSDFLHWKTINTNVANGSIIIPDPDVAKYSQRFYRAIEAP